LRTANGPSLPDHVIPQHAKYISLAGTTWPSTQCGQTTDTFKLLNFVSARASVSIEVLTSCEVFGQRYVRMLIFHLFTEALRAARLSRARFSHYELGTVKAYPSPTAFGDIKSTPSREIVSTR
jgi:hypothetical protein